MPLFDYRCRACGHQFEALVRAQDAPPHECPECHAGELERLLSVFAPSSSGMRQASAAKQVASAARKGRQETAAMDRDHDAHRHEEH